jgi:hypothetical protein
MKKKKEESKEPVGDGKGMPMYGMSLVRNKDGSLTYGSIRKGVSRDIMMWEMRALALEFISSLEIEFAIKGTVSALLQTVAGQRIVTPQGVNAVIPPK